MSNPTRQEIVKAHEALTHLIDYDLADAYTEADTEEVYERDQLIRKFLPPIPESTMAEEEWDDDEHYLAEAEHPTLGKVIMIFQSPNTGNIFFISPNGGVQHLVYCLPSNLIPTGKRYTLMEDQS